jgi:hypothetical protein
MNISTNLKEKALRTSRALAIVMGLVASSQESPLPRRSYPRSWGLAG